MSFWPSLADIAKQTASGKISARSNVEKALEIIDSKSSFKAIIDTTEKRALERAEEIDKKIKSGQNAGRLAGVPFIAKDNFLTFGANTTAASNMLKNFDAPYQSTAIDKLESEGAICVAKANLDAFAHGSSTENSDFFTTHNPHDKNHVPGGSSGGSAAAIMLDMAPFALGTDTGGSIRQPASFCGAIGYKPTYGLVSRSGVIAMASSTDVIGPLSRNVEDAALVLDVMSGRDPLDATTIDRDSSSYLDLKTNLKGKKIGVIKQYMGEGLDPGVKKQIDQSIEAIKDAGASIIEVSLPSVSLSLAVYYILVPAEISSNLSRYDGQKYGYSDKGANDLEASYSKSRSRGFNIENKRRIMIGTYVLSSGYYDAYYKKAQTVRTKIINEFNKAFESVDLMLGPTAPSTAFKIGANTADPLKMYLMDVMTVAANLTGMPAISIPVGKSEGMPVGLQLMAPPRHDRNLLSSALSVEALKL